MTKETFERNPRGLLWTKDESRFGLRMLQKMGWKKGRGLGANEDGMLEPIKVRPKSDAKGVGYRERMDQWADHQEDFASILNTLNGNYCPKPEPEVAVVKSLEEKSKLSRRRVHYHKFTRGKDLSGCSEKDLSCIVGKKRARDDKDDSAGSYSSHDQTTNSLNIEEYFAQKLSTLRASDGESDEHRAESPAKRARWKKVAFKEEIAEIHEISRESDLDEESEETSEFAEQLARETVEKPDELAESTIMAESTDIDVLKNNDDSNSNRNRKLKKKDRKHRKNMIRVTDHSSSSSENEIVTQLSQLNKKKTKSKFKGSQGEENGEFVSADDETALESDRSMKKKSKKYREEMT